VITRLSFPDWFQLVLSNTDRVSLTVTHLSTNSACRKATFWCDLKRYDAVFVRFLRA